jgi:hypothetical protein
LTASSSTADIRRGHGYIRFVHEETHAPQQLMASFNHLAGAAEQRQRARRPFSTAPMGSLLSIVLADQ